jgi:hypothetical protein
MNLELLESFGQNFPEDFDGTLDCMSVAISCQFNRCLINFDLSKLEKNLTN